MTRGRSMSLLNSHKMRDQLMGAQADLRRLDEERDVLMKLIASLECWLKLHDRDTAPAAEPQREAEA